MSQLLNLPTRLNPLVRGQNEIIFEKKLGQGAFGQVFKIRLKTRNGIFALKKVNITRSIYID